MKTIRTLLALAVLLIGTGQAEAQKLDAIHSADFAARTAVQTIYHNLITNGYEWRWIRDEKMPEILIHSVAAIKREVAKQDKQLILKTFIPTYVSSFFDEIDKINREQQERCMDVTFVVRTLIPFFKECHEQLGDFASLPEIVGPVLQVEFTFHVCETLAACQESLSDKYLIVFGERLPPDDFYHVCVGDNY